MKRLPAFDSRDLWSLLADTIGIFGFLFFIKNEIDGAIGALELPEELDFYVLFFWAFAGAVMGGFLWGIVTRVNTKRQFMNSTMRSMYDPAGWAAALWAAITIAPTLMILTFLKISYDVVAWSEIVILSLSFLVGHVIGALAFYEYSPTSHVGLRKRISDNVRAPLNREFLLELLWSLFLILPGFALVALAKILFFDSDLSSWMFLRSSGIAIVFTSLGVAFFLLIAGTDTDTIAARGIVAAILLRMGIFFGLVLI